MKYLLIILTVLISTSCTKNVVQLDEDTICLDIHFGKSNNAPLRMSQITDSITYIQLDSTYMIGSIDELKYCNGSFYICDKHLGAIYSFNENGKALGEIRHKGRAAYEYYNLSDMDISQQNGDIHIWDATAHRFQIYSKSGEYKKSIKCNNEVIRDFAVMNNGDYLIYTPYYNKGARRGAWVIDSLGNFKKQLISISDDYKYGGVYDNYIIRIGNDTIGIMGGEDKDNIYHLTSDNAFITYHINYDISIPKKLQKKEVFDYNKYAGDIYTKNSYFENYKWLMFTSFNMKQSVVSFYDKTIKKHYHLSDEKDFIMDADLYGNILYLDDNKIICAIYPNTLKDIDKLREKLPNMGNNSNPVLVIGKMK